MSTTWKQVVLDTADAVREANGSTAKIPVGQLADKVRAGAGIPYEGENPLTIGSDGYTFPAKTLLRDGLQIVNGVNGEDLTGTAAEQILAVENLLKMVSRKVADHKGEGKYVWKKYNDSQTYSYNLISVSGDTHKLQITNPVGFEPSKVDLTFFTGSTGMIISAGGATYECSIPTDGTFHISPIAGSGSAGDCPITYNPSTGQFDFGSWVVNTWSISNGFSFVGIGEFISYVTANEEDAYPDGGTLDGYYYKRVVEGVPVTVEEGVVTLTSTSTAVTVQHSLGNVPSYVAFLPETINLDLGTEASFLAVNDKVAYRYASGGKMLAVGSGNGGVVKTNSNVKFNAVNLRPWAATTYHWFVVK